MIVLISSILKRDISFNVLLIHLGDIDLLSQLILLKLRLMEFRKLSFYFFDLFIYFFLTIISTIDILNRIAPQKLNCMRAGGGSFISEVFFLRFLLN